MVLPANETRSTLQRGARAAEVERLQALLNRVGALLSVDGAFGPGTEEAVKEAQQLAGLPVTGIADAATWAWLAEQPEPSDVIPTEAVTFIVREEVGSRRFYDRHVAMPHFPGEASGVTIGVGYDLRFQAPADFEADWAGILTPAQMEALRPHLGRKGSAEAVAALADLHIPFHAAWKVFVKRALPRGIQQTVSCYGTLSALPPPCRGALVSLVYNRGTKLTGDSRREMKAIRDHIDAGRLDRVAPEFESMKRLWPGSEGLRKRRDREAEMWCRGLVVGGDPTWVSEAPRFVSEAETPQAKREAENRATKIGRGRSYSGSIGGLAGIGGTIPVEPYQEPAGPRPERRFLEVRLSGDAFAPGVTIDVECALLVEKSGIRGAATKEVETDSSIPTATFHLTAIGFEKVSKDTITVALPRGEDSETAYFKLRVLVRERFAISVSVFQGGRFVGEVCIDHPEAHLPVATADVAVPASSRAELKPAAVDADLTIFFESIADKVRVSSPRSVLNIESKNVGHFSNSAVGIIESVRERVNQLYSGDATLEDIKRELLIVGSQIRRVLPAPLIEYLESEKIGSLCMKIGADADFPIELCTLEVGEEEELLCDRLAVSRWYQDSRAAANCSSYAVASIAQVVGLLRLGFETEESAIKETCSSISGCLTKVESRPDFVELVLKQSTHNLIHLKGHLGHGPGQKKYITFGKGEGRYSLEELGAVRIERQAFECQPLIVMNGCDAAIGEQLIGGPDSFPFRFIQLNATAFVGTLWQVDERPATVFTQYFYKALRRNETACNAVKAARLELARRAEDATEDLHEDLRMAYYLASKAYVFFGPNDLRVIFQ